MAYSTPPPSCTRSPPSMNAATGMRVVESGHVAELDTAQPCRNPLDPPPYPEGEGGADEDVSFPSLFLAATGSELADAELKHSWHRLQALIAKCLETDSTPADTVDMVHEFYTQHIQVRGASAPLGPPE